MHVVKRLFLVGFVMVFMLAFAGMTAAQNLIENGDLETVEPFWWFTNEMGGTLTWAEDEASNGMRSLKIVKDAGTAASWMSGNQAQTYWNRMEAVLYECSFYAKTMGVNTAPAGENEEIGVHFTFLTEGESVGEVFVPVDQTSADVDWTQYTGEILLSDVPDEAFIEAIMGSDASGTAWFDQFGYSAEEWSAGVFGWSAETPAGFMNWTSGDLIGFADMVEHEDSHTGTHCAKLMETDAETDEMVFYTTPVPVTPGHTYYASVWVYVEDINTDWDYYPTSNVPHYIADRFALNFFFHVGDIEHSWDLVGGDRFIYPTQVEVASEWRQIGALITAPEEAAGFSMRARFNTEVMGTVYYDDFSLEEVMLGDNLVENADLETMEPFFWEPGDENGTLTWADDEASEGMKSLKIEKDATGDAASWLSMNQAQTYWNRMEAVLYECSFYAKTMGVNTDPAGYSEEIGVHFTFYTNDVSVGEAWVTVDQTTADTDWTQYTGEILLSDVPDAAYIEGWMSDDATGTVWFDQFGYSAEEWSAGVFGWSAETPAGFMNWTSGDLIGFANMVEYEMAHSGTHAAKLLETDAETDEMVFYSVPVPVTPEMAYEFSVWMKTASISPLDPEYWPSGTLVSNVAERACLNWFWHTGDIAHSWDLTGGDKFVYCQQIDETQDWTHYRVTAVAPPEATGASMRARYNTTVQGEIYYDDFAIREMDIMISGVNDPSFEAEIALPTTITLEQNYPNPFNSTTTIHYSLPTFGNVHLEVYDVLGRQVAVLADGFHMPGSHMVSFSSGLNDLNLGSGMYFYRLNFNGQSVVRKMIYLK